MAKIDIASLHANMTEQQRANTIDAFTDNPGGSQVLVCSYRVGSIGLNLQNLCHFAIVVEPATSSPIQDQAIFRIRRLNQHKKQTTILLHQRHTHNDWQYANQKRKVLPGLVSQMSDEGLVEWNVPGGDPDSDEVVGLLGQLHDALQGRPASQKKPILRRSG